MDKLKEVLDAALVNAEKESQARRKGKPAAFYPSSIGKCMRAIVYQMLGYDTGTPDARGLTIMANGTSFHERFEGLLDKAGILIAAESPIELPELMIRGRSDAIIKNVYDHKVSDRIVELKDLKGNVMYKGPESEVMVTELKSINSKNFAKVSEYRQPKPEHIQQIHIYLYALKLTHGVLVYENKDTQEQYMHPVDYDEKTMEYVLGKIQAAIEFYNRKELPNKEFMRSSYECKFCDFYDYCWPQFQQLSIDEILGIAE